MGTGENSEDLIDELYAASENPERFDALMLAWEAHLAANGGSQDERLSPHLSRALRLFEQVEAGSAEEDAVTHILELMPAAAVVLDGRLSITAMSASAARMAGAPDAATLEELIGGTAYRRLQRWVDESELEAEGDILYLSVGGAFPPGTNMLARRMRVVGRDTILLASTDMTLGEGEAEAFGSAFGLTAAETEIAVAVGEGHAVSDIAAARGVSELTVRTQLRKIFAKTGADGLTGLVRLVCGFATAATQSRPLAARRTPGDWRRHAVLPSGRRVGWLDMGHPRGRPVLMFHSMLMDGTLTRPCVAHLHAENWRFVAPARASVGDTPAEPSVGREEMAARAAKDAADVLDELGIAEAIVMGLSAGCLYAATFARLYPQRARALLFISHPPFWEHELLDKMPRRQRLMARTTVSAPGALRMIVRAGCASIMGGYHEAFLRGLYREGTADRTALTDPEVAEAAVAGLQAVARQGGGGFVDDGPLVLSDWTEDMAAAVMPQLVLYGDDDRVSGAAYADGYCAAVPQARRIELPGAGQLIHLSHWRDMLAALESLDEEARSRAEKSRRADR